MVMLQEMPTHWAALPEQPDIPTQRKEHQQPREHQEQLHDLRSGTDPAVTALVHRLVHRPISLLSKLDEAFNGVPFRLVQRDIDRELVKNCLHWHLLSPFQLPAYS